MNRRDLLKGLCATSIASYPLYKFINILIAKDSLQQLSVPKLSQTRNYIQFNFYGGPTRWSYDHFLNPYGDKYYHHPMANNQISQNLINKENIYRQTEYKGVNIPILWDEILLDKTPMKEQLNNALIIRGAHLQGTTGHPMSSSKTVAPSIGGASIDGLLADKSDKLLSSITVGDTPVNRAFKSKGSSCIQINGEIENKLSYLLNPFYLESNAKKNQEIDIIVDKVIDVINQSERSHKLKEDLKKTRKYFRENISDFLNEYSILTKKYNQLIEESLKHRIVGIDDKEIPTPNFPITVEGDKSIDDILGPYKITNVYMVGIDLREILKSVKIGQMSENFALAEFISKYGLSSSIVFANKNEIGDMFDNVLHDKVYTEDMITREYNKSTNTTTLRANSSPRRESPKLSFDSHTTGSIVNTLTCTKFYYAFSNCLNELIRTLRDIQLNKGSLFDETIIHVTSEFDRWPNDNLAGSAHNEQAHISTFYSGIIQGPIVLGNIFTGEPDSDSEAYTIGNSAPVKELNQRVHIGHISSTLSTLLRLPPIMKRAESLIEILNGKVVPKIERARNVKGTYEDFIS
ncbi:hypothetical protein BIY24_07355 [Halobacteriovorax marinus]|uniref:hypothetical protein n=1 Tax=Halobacteriovorax marinus TaxID=97084 RepID=UPI000BC346EB|nr:hypothetical protein [Halobacteriovorax marinus]ATH07769.1 hypothetical protein BIY24_07355 [Halobacteriovorax marinus]